MVGAEEVRGEENAPGLLKVATVELVLNVGQSDVQDILLLGRKVLSKHTVVTTLNRKERKTENLKRMSKLRVLNVTSKVKDVN